MPAAQSNLISAAGFGGEGTTEGPQGAAGLNYQHFTTDLNAHGYLGGTLTKGRRATPDPGSFFSSPPTAGRNLSSAQFAGGADAKSGGGAEEAEAEEY